jgi:hypothetical protein
LRPESGYLAPHDGQILQQPFLNLGGYDQPNGLQNSLNRLKNTKQVQLNDDALRLIA